MTFTIRAATVGDVELLTSLIRTAFSDVAERFNLTPENCPTHPSNCTADWIGSALEKGVLYFILEADKRPCGCVALERANSDVCYLERLGVLPAFRRQGFGKALVQHALETARDLGASNIEIGIISDQEELQKWYNGLGFSRKGRRRFNHLPFEVTFMVLPQNHGRSEKMK
ncbi:MAG: GNAT family N-acetyltransferase [Deltaproteobacteria bacterium]|jgi:N-acetylglutamate synthase-like GNAT family acetyltransferase